MEGPHPVLTPSCSSPGDSHWDLLWGSFWIVSGSPYCNMSFHTTPYLRRSQKPPALPCLRFPFPFPQSQCVALLAWDGIRLCLSECLSYVPNLPVESLSLLLLTAVTTLSPALITKHLLLGDTVWIIKSDIMQNMLMDVQWNCKFSVFLGLLFLQ